jgi:replicative DNA helicase
MRKELVVLGGFTGAGKSFIAGQMLYNATKNCFNTAYFSLEISNEMIVSRLLGQESDIKPTRIMTGKISEEERKKQIEAQARLSIYNEKMTFYDDQYYLGEILKTINDNNFDYVVIDFIQNVMDKGDEYEKLSKVSLEFQKIAKEKNCCIVVLSQLSNNAYKTDALEYKGSGSIATVCDLGIFVVRKEETLDQMTLKVRKNRRGRSGIEVELQSFYPSGRIVEL